MHFEQTGIDGVVLIRIEPHADMRGTFARMFCVDEMSTAGLPFRVAQASLSRNIARYTLRGLHLQRAPHREAKIVSCPRGRIWDVAVDMREGSNTHRQWRAFELSSDGTTLLHLPEGVAHGFLTLEPDSEVHYFMSSPYVAGAALGFRWDDPAFSISWPATPMVISHQDRNHPILSGHNLSE